MVQDKKVVWSQTSEGRIIISPWSQIRKGAKTPIFSGILISLVRTHGWKINTETVFEYSSDILLSIQSGKGVIKTERKNKKSIQDLSGWFKFYYF